MARQPTKPGRLSDLARHVVLPSGLVSTGWPAVRDLCAEFGDSFDVWQDDAGRAFLAKRNNGRYAATVGGIVLSWPRQVAKTFLVGRTNVALCVLFPGTRVLWTAHHARTSTNTFRTLQGYVRRPKVWPHVLSIRSANGEQEIAFRNGSIIMFGARAQGFGRGFDQVDVEVFDEAQILTEKALEDMVAATNQARHPHGALLFYMGTPPRPVDPGEAFTLKRADALSGESDDMVYIECSADQDADPDDREQWAKANPSFPQRTPLESMLRLRKNLSSVEAWRREALGIWDADAADDVFGPGKWAVGSTEDRPAGLSLGALGVAMSYDLLHGGIVGASQDGDLVYVKPLHHESGTGWLPERVKALQDAHEVDVLIDGRGPAAVLIPKLELVGVRLTVLGTGEVLDACAGMFDLVAENRLRHTADPEMDAQVACAVRRPVGDRWAWGRRASSSDISLLEAATCAVHGLTIKGGGEPNIW